MLERRKQAYDMWLMGTDYVTIGRALGRSKKLALLGPGGVHGYGDVDEDGDPVEDGVLAERVRTDLVRVRRERARHLDDTVAEHRQAMVDQHLRMLGALGPALLRGDPQAHSAAVKHLERVAKLKGLDSPQKFEVGSDDPLVREAVQGIMDAIDAAAAAKQKRSGVATPPPTDGPS